MAGLQLSGLASGIDWKSIVDQLMQVEQAPITRIQKEQAKNTDQSNALEILKNKFSALQTSSISLSNSGLYARRSTALSSSTSTWSSKASDSTAIGSYKFTVSQLATASTLKGANDIGRAIAPDGNLTGLTMATLPTATAVTAGSFTVNGKKITIAASDNFSDVLAQIGTATGGDVTASYNSTTDKVELTAAVGKTIVLGAANDSSNFIQAMRLSNADNATSLTSANSLGATSTSAALSSARFNTALSGQNPDGSGSFSINGVSIDYNVNTDTLGTILTKINSGGTGVTATYDSANDRINISNTATGDTGFSISDTTGNLLSSMGLTSGTTLTRGKNAIFTLNDGGTLVSTSNTLDESAHGVTGLSVTATSETTQTVSVAADNSAAKSAISDFIAKFNDIQDYIETKTKISKDSSGKVTTSTLTSNREVQSWASKLRAMAFQAFSGDIARLADMGIDFTTGTDKLEIKSATKLDAALTNSSTAVQSFFTTKDTGFASRFNTYATEILGNGNTSGGIPRQTNALATANKSLDKQIEDINRRLAQQRSVLESAFLAMEQAQSKANGILSQLSKSFS